MERTPRWITRTAIGLGVFAALLVAAGAVVAVWIPNDEEIAHRIEDEFEARLGQRLTIGRFEWQVFPQALVTVRDARTHQDEPITVRSLELRPQLWPLLRGRVVIDTLRVDGAVVPRNAMAAFRGKPEPSGEEQAMDAFALHRLEFVDVSYVSYSGIPVAYDGEVEFDADWRPRRAQIRRPGATPPAVLDVVRDGQQDRWGLNVRVAGGTADGQAWLDVSPQGRMTLAGELAPRDVEVEQLMNTFHRRSPVGGLASGRTVLQAQGDTLGEVVRSLHSRSDLSAKNARILRIDLDRAVKTLGKDRDGETPLDTLTGRVDTQNTANGMKITFSRVKGTAGRYSAVGQATIYQRQLQADGLLSIGDGLVDVPFSASGPVRRPDFKISKALFAGAAIGTAVLPGIGTVIGAKIGAALSGPPSPATRPVSPRRQ